MADTPSSRRARAIDVLTMLAVLGLLVAAGWSTGVALGHPRLDQIITDWVVDHRTSPLDRLAPIVTDLASPVIYVPLVALTMALAARARSTPRVVTTPVLAVVGARIVSRSVKELVGKERPPIALRLVTEHTPAFPSGHAITAMAAWGIAALLVAALVRGPARVAVLVVGALVIVAVGASRVYLGVHWASDVVAGWALGAVWLAVLLRRIGYPRVGSS